MIPEHLTTEQIQVFLLVFVRITTMVALIPVIGSQSVPGRLKAGLSFLIAIILFPLVPVNQVDVSMFTLPRFALLVVQELFVGITIGFAASLLFAAVQFAGRIVDTQMGFALVRLVDPFSNAASTVTGQFQIIIFSIVFLLINGHYFFLLAIQKSFEVIPLITVHMPSEHVGALLIKMVADVFVLAIRLAAPIYSVLILTSLSLGIVARTVPQINIFFVGLPLKIGLGVTTMAIVLPALVMIFRSMVDMLIQDIWKLLYLMA